MARELRAPPVLAEGQSLFPRFPRTLAKQPAPGGPVFSSGLRRDMHLLVGFLPTSPIISFSEDTVNQIKSN